MVGDMDTIHGDSDIGDSTMIFMDIITEIGIIGIILIIIIHSMVILIIKEIIILQVTSFTSLRGLRTRFIKI